MENKNEINENEIKEDKENKINEEKNKKKKKMFLCLVLEMINNIYLIILNPYNSNIIILK